MSLQWERISGYAIKSGPYRICRCTVKGQHVFEAWHHQTLIGESRDPDQSVAIAQVKAICEDHITKEAA